MKYSIRRYSAFLIALSLLVSAMTACSSSETSSSSISEAQTIASEADNSDESKLETVASKSDAEPIADISYDSKLFDTSYVHTIDITIKDEDWSDLTENPLDKTKYDVNITIDGETINDVSFSTKGNTSLSSIASDNDNDRYSFKVNFGKFVDGQTYYGLNKLNLNNIYADATYMKDYLSYGIFRQAGVDSPLVSYVWLTVNGKEQGLYIAIEDISESYLSRTTDGEGELYKPETSQLANMDKFGKDMKMPDGMDFDFSGMDGEFPQDFSNMTPPDGKNKPSRGDKSSSSNEKQPSGNETAPSMPDGMEFPGNGEMPSMPDDMEFPGDGEMPSMPDGMEFPGDGKMPGGMMSFGDSTTGAGLAYSDDSIESYPDIFDNDITDADDDAKQRVITALKGLSEGTNLESCLDTDEIIRYFAAHNFVLNYDSYTGSMLHNYYLYENDGKLSMLPWDYNLAFGGFGGSFGKGGDGSAASLINTGIDTPLSGSQESSRPMWSWITSNENYLEKYHQVYDELLTNYFESGEFEKQIDAVYEMILPYVEKDPTAFYTVDEFKKGYTTLKEFCKLRAESIRAQLDGKLSTESDKQSSEDQVDASNINIEDMGKQNGGPDGGDMKMPSGMKGRNNKDNDNNSSSNDNAETAPAKE